MRRWTGGVGREGNEEEEGREEDSMRKLKSNIYQAHTVPVSHTVVSLLKGMSAALVSLPSSHATEYQLASLGPSSSCSLGGTQERRSEGGQPVSRAIGTTTSAGTAGESRTRC